MKQALTTLQTTFPRFKYLLSIGLFLLPLLLIAQQPAPKSKLDIKGKVISAEDKQPMFGVTIMERGTGNGTITELDGSYTINAASDATLEFKYVGFEDLNVSVQGRSIIDIIMQPGSLLLNQILVTGYKKEIKSDVASSISSVKAKDIEKLLVVGFDQALQGQAPGVMVTQATGAPGDDISVRIRGVGTIGNNEPLYIIDGVPTTGNINMLSTNDIESIEVLKDGAAAAIYGARAANGVVVITTKKGKAGKATFTFDSYAGIQEANRLPELLNAEEYLMIRNEAITNANSLRIPARHIPLYNTAILDTLPDVDWLSEVFSKAPIQRHLLSASGGSENGNYYLMGEYLNQDGVFRGQSYEKYVLRFNGEAGSKRLKIGNNLSFALSDRKVIGSSGDGYGPGNEISGIRYALIAAPVFRPRYADGSYVKVSSELGDPTLYGDGNANPLAIIDATDWTVKRYRFFGNVFAELNLLEGLNLRSNIGGDFLFVNEKLFKERLSAAIYDPSSLSEGRVIDQTLVWNNTMDFQRSFGKHRMSALLGMEAVQNETNYLGASANNFALTTPLFRYINTSVPVDIQNIGASGVVTEWALLSYFAQAAYTYDNKYVLNAAVRRDGSSRFGKDNRYGYFPSVSAAWNISNERFVSELPIISTMKIRASWGQLGNQEIGIYPFSSLIETGKRVYSFGDKVVTGATLVETGNSNIKWETTTQINFGLDLGLLKDRLSIVADYYRKRTSDVLVRVPVPQAGGPQNPPFVNAGEVENKGFELGVLFKNSAPDFKYTIGGNIATVKNKVLSISDSEPILGGFGLSDGPITKTEPGYPIGSFFLWKMLGIFQTQAEIDASPFQSVDTRPGDIRFADINGDGAIDDKDRSHIGSPFPDFIYGLNATLAYKNFDLYVLAQGIQGNDVYFLYGNFAYEVPARGFNSYKDILNRWTPSNTDTNIPKVSFDDRNGNKRISTRWLEDGSYLRIRNITIGYNFKHMLASEAISSLRLYFSAQNAFTFTTYSGLDPEIQANTNDTRGVGVASDLAVGIDWGTVPAPRSYILGVKLDF